MKLTTIHYLTCTVTCPSALWPTAKTIIERGAEGYKLGPAKFASVPLADGGDPSVQTTHVTLSSPDNADLTLLGENIEDTMRLIGVEVRDADLA